MYSISKPRIDQKSLKCRNSNCEFYAHPQFDHFCSKCYREKVLRERLAQGKMNKPGLTARNVNFCLLPASRSKLSHKGVSEQKHPDGHQHSTAASSGAPAEDKKSKKRNILEVFKKTTSLTSKDSFKESKKHRQQKHVEVMEPVAIAHLEMLRVSSEISSVDPFHHLFHFSL